MVSPTATEGPPDFLNLPPGENASHLHASLCACVQACMVIDVGHAFVVQALQTCMQAWVCACTNVYVHACRHVHVCMRAFLQVYICMHACVNACMRAWNICACVHTCMRTCVYACMRAHVNTCTRDACQSKSSLNVQLFQKCSKQLGDYHSARVFSPGSTCTEIAFRDGSLR